MMYEETDALVLRQTSFGLGQRTVADQPEAASVLAIISGSGGGQQVRKRSLCSTCSSRMIAFQDRLGITIGRENTSKEHYCETVYAAGGGGGDRVLRLQRLQSCWRYVLYCTRPTSSLLSPCLLPSDLPLLLPPPRDVTCRVRFSTSFSLHVSLSN